MQKGLVSLPKVAAELVEGYLSCGGSTLRGLGLTPQAGLHSPDIGARKGHPDSIWLWKPVGFLPVTKRQHLLDTQAPS